MTSSGETYLNIRLKLMQVPNGTGPDVKNVNLTLNTIWTVSGSANEANLLKLQPLIPSGKCLLYLDSNLHVSIPLYAMHIGVGTFSFG